MEQNQSKSQGKTIRYFKENGQIQKSQIRSESKNKKVNSVKSSLEKLFRIKSKSDHFVICEDLKVGIIPQTIYLTPQETKSLSRSFQQMLPTSKDSIVGGINSTFGVSNTVTSTKPPEQLFLSANTKPSASKPSSVPHSMSMPLQLSKSHQNINNARPSQRNVRRKGIFNCSLFRKKSVEVPAKRIQSCNQSTSLNRSKSNQDRSIISDRCHTLPDLHCSPVDLNPQSDCHNLVGMDLIKDYLNRSNSSLQLSVQCELSDCTSGIQSQCFTTSQCLINGNKKSKVPKTDSTVSVNRNLMDSFYSQKSASKDLHHSRTTSSNSSDGNANDVSFYKVPNVTSTADERQKPPFLKQFSVPIYSQPTTNHHQYHSPLATTNGAVEFWTRPYEEKLKASRRRLLDDKVGSKEALLRSLSPHNVRSNDDHASLHQLHIIPEPVSLGNIDPMTPCKSSQQDVLNHSISVLNSDLYRGQLSPVSAVTEISNLGHQHRGNTVIFCEDRRHETGKPTVTETEINPSNTGPNQTASDKESPFRRNPYGSSWKDMKDNKSINSSIELILTRTPTPPHSFAESPVSSTYPVPKEFISEIPKSKSHPSRLCDNLLCASDHVREPQPPIPPPRIDSIIRSIIVQSEFEYDLGKVFPTETNIDRCDIREYNQWLEKLPYRLTSICSPVHDKVNKVPRKSHLPQRKAVKSWNVSRNSKPVEEVNDQDRVVQGSESRNIKRCHSYGECLDNDVDPHLILTKQYSHLYSLKPSPSQINLVLDDFPSALVGKKLNRSKSFDCRNSSGDSSSEKSLGYFTDNGKGALNRD